MIDTRFRTVLSAMPSCRAIRGLSQPFASRASASRSRPVSSTNGPRASPDAMAASRAASEDEKMMSPWATARIAARVASGAADFTT